jgi:transketolase
VVSLPSWELFEAQPQRYKDTVIPPSITKRIGIESGISLGWDRYIGTEGKMIGLDHYGASAPANILMEQFGFTGENVLQTALKILN